MSEEEPKKKPDDLKIARQISRGATVYYDQDEEEKDSGTDKNKTAPSLWKKLKGSLGIGK